MCTLHIQTGAPCAQLTSLNYMVIKSTVLPGEKEGVEHIEEHLIVVKIIPPVCKGTSGSDVAFKRANHLAPFFDHFAHFFVQ